LKRDQQNWVDDSQNAISIGFIEYLKLIEDSRQASKTNHSLLEIIFISVCAYICGANSWDGVYEFAKTREIWLRKYITRLCTILSVDFLALLWHLLGSIGSKIAPLAIIFAECF